MSDTGVAPRNIRHATIQAVSPGQQIDLWADRIIVMAATFKWHVQPADQSANIHRHAEQAVDMNPRHRHRAQYQG